METYPDMITTLKDPGEEPRRPEHIAVYFRVLCGKRVLKTARLMAGHPQPRLIPCRRYQLLLEEVQKEFPQCFSQLSPACVRTIQAVSKQGKWFPNDPLRHDEGLEVCRMALKICKSITELQSSPGPLGDFAKNW